MNRDDQVQDSSRDRRFSMVLRAISILWTLPNTLFGLFFGVINLLFRGKIEIHEGCIECYGGFITAYLNKIRVTGMTLGHVIIGQSAEGLKFVRVHEHVHVRQYERWGPFFIPAYLLSSAWLWWQGKEYYRNNPFEAEAYRIDDPSARRSNSAAHEVADRKSELNKKRPPN